MNGDLIQNNIEIEDGVWGMGYTDAGAVTPLFGQEAATEAERRGLIASSAIEADSIGR